jgi:hypothetical protein
MFSQSLPVSQTVLSLPSVSCLFFNASKGWGVEIGLIRVADDEKLKRTAKWENSKEMSGAAYRIAKMTPTLRIVATNHHHTT